MTTRNHKKIALEESKCLECKCEAYKLLKIHLLIQLKYSYSDEIIDLREGIGRPNSFARRNLLHDLESELETKKL
jgi:hypothetical protein